MFRIVYLNCTKVPILSLAFLFLNPPSLPSTRLDSTASPCTLCHSFEIHFAHQSSYQTTPIIQDAWRYLGWYVDQPLPPHHITSHILTSNSKADTDRKLFLFFLKNTSAKFNYEGAAAVITTDDITCTSKAVESRIKKLRGQAKAQGIETVYVFRPEPTSSVLFPFLIRITFPQIHPRRQ